MTIAARALMALSATCGTRGTHGARFRPAELAGGPPWPLPPSPALAAPKLDAPLPLPPPLPSLLTHSAGSVL